MNIHSDASYLSEPNSRSRACGHFFLGWLPVDGQPIRLNGVFHMLCLILLFVVASAAEAKLGALFLNCKEGMIFQLVLEDLGHPQPKTPVHCNNATAAGIAKNSTKRQCSRAMEMRYFWTSHKHTMCILLNGTPAKKIWRTIRINITLGHTTLQCAHITFMRKTPPWYYHGQQGLAL